MNTLRVAAVQMEHGENLDGNLRAARAMLERCRDRGAGLALLPEYFAATMAGPASHAADHERVRDFLQDASRELDIAIVANAVVPEGSALHNVGLAYDRGAPVARQQKIHPMPRENEEGVSGGARLDAFDLRGVPAGMLVCADILYPEAARILALQGAKLLLNPVMSAYRENDPTKAAREALYIARAYDAGAFVMKAGGFLKDKIAGRSLIAAPWGLLARYKDDFAEEILIADLDFARLDEFRASLDRFPARRPEAYDGLL